MDDKLDKIAELYFTGDQEMATAWLTQLIGEQNAAANIFVMECFKDMESDADIILSEDTFARMKFRTYSIRFGKDYRYDVDFNFMFQGVGHFTSRDFSRYQVGNGEPKDYLLELICNDLRKRGHELYNQLFVGTRKYFVVESE